MVYIRLFLGNSWEPILILLHEVDFTVSNILELHVVMAYSYAKEITNYQNDKNLSQPVWIVSMVVRVRPRSSQLVARILYYWWCYLDLYFMVFLLVPCFWFYNVDIEVCFNFRCWRCLLGKCVLLNIYFILIHHLSALV